MVILDILMVAPPSHMDGEEEQEKEMKIAVNKVKTKKVGLAFSFKPNCVSRRRKKN